MYSHFWLKYLEEKSEHYIWANTLIL